MHAPRRRGHGAAGAGARHPVRPRRCRTIARRSTAARWPGRSRRRSSSTTSRSGGPTASAARPPSRGRRPRSPSTRRRPTAAYGVLGSFTFSQVAERFDGLPADERRQLVLDTLTARLGPKAASPVDFVETAWWHEEWTRGCSMAHFKPGHPHELRPPAPRAVGPHPLGRHRDGDHLARRHRRRHPLRRARGGRDPRRRLSEGAPAVSRGA